MKSTDLSVKLWKLNGAIAIYDIFVCGKKIGMGVFDGKNNKLDLDQAVEFKVSLYRPYIARLIVQDLKEVLRNKQK